MTAEALPLEAPPTRNVGGRVIAPAVRRGKKSRIALAGPTGAGKTWTALVVAQELDPGSGILVIDTERGSASLYSDKFTFETVDWHPPYDPLELSKFIGEVSSDYGVIIIDSLSHFWKGEGGTLNIVDNVAARGNRNDKFGAWKEGTAVQDRMVEAMLQAKCHIIATMRSKMEYVTERDEKTGKNSVRKVGLAPVQRDDLEYEFTLLAEIDTEHRVMVTKSRCAVLADKVFPRGRADELGKKMKEWLDGGAEEVEPPAPPAAPFDWKGNLSVLPAEAQKAIYRDERFARHADEKTEPWVARLTEEQRALLRSAITDAQAANPKEIPV